MTKALLNDFKNKDLVTLDAIDKFLFSICSYVVSTVKKLLQRYRLGLVVIRNCVIFNPVVMQSADLNVVMKKLDFLMHYLVSANILRQGNADNAHAQYPKLLEEVQNAVVVEREFLDEFFFKKVSCCKYDVIFHVIKVLLIINRGQAYKRILERIQKNTRIQKNYKRI